MDIEYTKGGNDVLADAQYIFNLNGNQETTQKSNYQKEVVS